MDVGSDIIGMVETNAKVFRKDATDNTTKGFSGGTYLMLKRNRRCLGIGC